MWYYVMLECRTGTRRLIGDGVGARWEDEYHTITWCAEPTFEEASSKAADMMEFHNRDIRRAWVEVRETTRR